MKNNIFYITSESVLCGHPDKVCDFIADNILDAFLKEDEYSRVAVEVMASNNKIYITGQITTNAKNVNIEEVTRNAIKQIGYDNIKSGLDYKTCEIIIDIIRQSKDIQEKVDGGGAGDQGIMFGFACNETNQYMPYGVMLANKLAERIDQLRKKEFLHYLKPDGKTQVTIEYKNNKVNRIDTIIISVQHDSKIRLTELKEDILKYVILPIIDMNLFDENTKVYINPIGKFEIGGTIGDTGLTGRKIIVDTYGGYARHGGGAFSGKDPSKLDRSASYMLRYIAKNIVANSLADKCELQVAYEIGMEKPISFFIETFGTEKISINKIYEIVKNNFDLKPNNIIEELQLRKPIYAKTSNYGHFGKENMSWENIIQI